MDNHKLKTIIDFTLRSLGACVGSQNKNLPKDACYKGIKCIAILRDELDLVNEELAHAMNKAIDSKADLINECCSGESAKFTYQSLHDQLFGDC